MYQELAVKAYAQDTPKKRAKAIAAGVAMDNALKLEYTAGGTTHCRFLSDQYEAYFSPEALAHRNKLI
jgi:hypothetical protein